MTQQPPLAMIAALGADRTIGVSGTLPWHLPEDMRYFRRMTNHHAVIMGKKTYASLRRPLRDRYNLVVTRHPDALADTLSREHPDRLADCEMFASPEAALQRARELDPCPFVIGGGQLYEVFLPQTTHLYLTQTNMQVLGDTYFPAWPVHEWKCVREQQVGSLQFQLWIRCEQTEEKA